MRRLIRLRMNSGGSDESFQCCGKIEDLVRDARWTENSSSRETITPAKQKKSAVRREPDEDESEFATETAHKTAHNGSASVPPDENLNPAPQFPEKGSSLETLQESPGSSSSSKTPISSRKNFWINQLNKFSAVVGNFSRPPKECIAPLDELKKKEKLSTSPCSPKALRASKSFSSPSKTSCYSSESTKINESISSSSTDELVDPFMSGYSSPTAPNGLLSGYTQMYSASNRSWVNFHGQNSMPKCKSKRRQELNFGQAL